jgi:hypothetical protein
MQRRLRDDKTDSVTSLQTSAANSNCPICNILHSIVSAVTARSR